MDAPAVVDYLIDVLGLVASALAVDQWLSSDARVVADSKKIVPI